MLTYAFVYRRIHFFITNLVITFFTQITFQRLGFNAIIIVGERNYFLFRSFFGVFTLRDLERIIPFIICSIIGKLLYHIFGNTLERVQLGCTIFWWCILLENWVFSRHPLLIVLYMWYNCNIILILHMLKIALFASLLMFFYLLLLLYLWLRIATRSFHATSIFIYPQRLLSIFLWTWVWNFFKWQLCSSHSSNSSALVYCWIIGNILVSNFVFHENIL